MSDLISKGALMKKCACRKNCNECDFFTNGDSWCYGEVFGTTIMQMPTIDAEPVRYGEWAERYDEDSNPFFRRKFFCSECGKWQTYGKTDYCPNCGAKMDETEAEA